MNTAGNETLERIQREIKENLEKEEEWKRELERISNDKSDVINNNSQKDKVSRVNGVLMKQVSETSEKGNSKTQTVNKFIQNVKTKGMMQRFLKAKGKSIVKTTVPNGSFQPNKVITDFTYQPPRATAETGTLSRNGFVPADVKIRKEVQHFQQREIELRNERRKSQPELMALLSIENEEIRDEAFPEYSCSSSASSVSELKSSRSLADLCNTPEEELETPGTHNLIKQFESWKKL